MMLCFLFFTVFSVMVISCNVVKFLEQGILVLYLLHRQPEDVKKKTAGNGLRMLLLFSR